MRVELLTPRLEMVPGELHISLCITSAGRVQEALRELALDRVEPEGRLAAFAGPVSSPGPTPAGTR